MTAYKRTKTEANRQQYLLRYLMRLEGKYSRKMHFHYPLMVLWQWSNWFQRTKTHWGSGATHDGEAMMDSFPFSEDELLDGFVTNYREFSLSAGMSPYWGGNILRTLEEVNLIERIANSPHPCRHTLYRFSRKELLDA